MEDMNSVIRRSTSRVGPPADKDRITNAAHIKPVLCKIILAPALACQLTETINCVRIHYAILRRVMLRRMRPENRYRTWPENFGYFKFNCKIKHVQQAGHV